MNPKWIPSLIPVVMLIATLVAPMVQAWMAAHPVVMTIGGVIVMVLNHLLPSPVKQAEPTKVEVVNPLNTQGLPIIRNSDASIPPPNPPPSA